MNLAAYPLSRSHLWVASADRTELQDLDGPLAGDGRARRFRLRVRGALMDVLGRRPIDQQAEQFGTAVVTARVHESLAGVDLGKVEISDHFAFDPESADGVDDYQSLEIGLGTSITF